MPIRRQNERKMSTARILRTMIETAPEASTTRVRYLLLLLLSLSLIPPRAISSNAKPASAACFSINGEANTPFRRPFMRTKLRFALSALFLILALSPLHAQVVGGSIHGTVTDASGSAVTGANVTVFNEETGNVRHLITDASGRYSAPSVPVGTYLVTVDKTRLCRGKAVRDSADCRPERHHRPHTLHQGGGAGGQRGGCAADGERLHAADLRPRQRAPGERPAAERPQL